MENEDAQKQDYYRYIIMAEGWTRHLRAETIEAYSAGIVDHGLDRRAVKVMAEVGIDISQYRSKTVNIFKDVEFDYVIALCGHAHESCPLFPGKARVIHRGFDDPPTLAQQTHSEEEALQSYRRIRDEIKTFILTFPDFLTHSQENDLFRQFQL
ncbi:MAG: arsenate reductase ArsC [bacterium]